MKLTDMLIQLASAGVCSFGFALLYRLKGKRVLASTLGGILTWGVYLLGQTHFSELFLLNLFAAVFAAVWSEVMARVCKCPSTVFLAPTVIPLAPGGSLYYTLLYLLANEKEQSARMGFDTLSVACGMAVGVVVVSIAVRFFFEKPQSAEYVKKM